MENNFGLILLDLVRANKDKFLGLLRRNGVLVNTNISNENLTNMILKAMLKSESFKKETILLMSVLSAEDSYSNVNGFGRFNVNPVSDTLGYTNKYIPQTVNETTSTTESTTTTDKPKKAFADTTVGTIFDKLFTLGNAYLTNKELDVRKAEANASQVIATTGGANTSTPPPPKSNTGLYVALGLGGVVLVGTLVYLISKKK